MKMIEKKLQIEIKTEINRNFILLNLFTCHGCHWI